MCRTCGRWISRHRHELLFFGVTLFVVALSLSPVYRDAGWPRNHEALSFKYRTEIYAEHIRQGDMLPVWASSDAFGMGTPLPLFYHKAFYLVSAPLLLLTGKVKAAILLAIAAFMIVGAVGMRSCVSKLSSDRLLLLLGPVAFLLSNYAFTNWLVRGAMAEFSAMMMTPWIISWGLTLLTEKRFSYSIVPAMFILYLAHSAIALAAAVPTTVAYGISVTTETGGLRATVRRAATSVAALAVLLAPLLLITRVFLRDYDVGKITEAGYTPVNHFHAFSSYFLDRHYVWLRDWQGYTVQVDYGLWVGAVVILGVYVCQEIGHRRRGAVQPFDRRVLALLTLPTLAFLFLQTRASRGVYSNLRLLDYFQFPWRLLAYITPLLVVLVCYGFGVLCRTGYRRPGQLLMLAWLVSFVALMPVTHHFRYESFHGTELELAVPAGRHGLGGALVGVGEYLPIVERNGRQLGTGATVSTYIEHAANGTEAAVLDGGPCMFAAVPLRSFEVLDKTLEVRCERPSRIALPASYSRYAAVVDMTHGKRRLRVHRVAEDPRVVVGVGAGTRTLKIQLPTVLRIVGGLLG